MTKLNIFERPAMNGITAHSHIYRQICGTFASFMMSISNGITFGFSALLLPQLANDKNFPYDESFNSWIASVLPMAMMVGCLFSGSLSDGLGRRLGQTLLVLPYTIGWIIMGFAYNNTLMLIGRFITGVCIGAMRTNTLVYICEITDPKYRTFALFAPGLAINLGNFFTHLLGKYVYWRINCFINIVPTAIAFIMLCFLPESPLWLLTKGRIDEGIESFRLFRGNGVSADVELDKVLHRCKENMDAPTFRDYCVIVFSKPFMKSLTITFFLFVAVQWCGIVTLLFYAQDIFEKTFEGQVDAFLLIMITDCIRILTATAVCIFARAIPQRITFVLCCFTTSLMLIVLSAYLHYKPNGFLWLGMTSLIIYLIVASIITSMAWAFISEIFPGKVRGFGSGISSGMSYILLFISVKVSPEIMNIYGEVAMYLCFACVTVFSGGFLMFFLTETNGKSLQDIEDELFKKKVNLNFNGVSATQRTSL